MTDGAVVWFTGLPGAGKSTLAADLAARLRAEGTIAAVLDSDEVRAALVPRPGHDEAARDAFYRSLAGLAGLLARHFFQGSGLILLVAMIGAIVLTILLFSEPDDTEDQREKVVTALCAWALRARSWRGRR